MLVGGKWWLVTRGGRRGAVVGGVLKQMALGERWLVMSGGEGAKLEGLATALGGNQ